MLKKRRDAAMKVAERLWAAEDAIDAALARAAELNGTLVAARSEADLSAMVVQDAFEVAAATFAALAKARGEIIETHRRLTEAKNQVGLRAVGFGDQGKPGVAAEANPHLKAVA